MKKILGAIQHLSANQHSQFSPIPQIMTELAVLVSWQILNGSQDFLHTFSITLYHKWVVKNVISFALQFFLLISDNLGGVYCLVVTSHPRPIQMTNEWTYRPQLHSFPSDVLSHRHHLVNNGVHLLQIPKKITLISSKDYSKAHCT